MVLRVLLPVFRFIFEFHPDRRDSLVLRGIVMKEFKLEKFHPDRRDSLVLRTQEYQYDKAVRVSSR